MKTKNSFIVSLVATVALSFLTACGTMRQHAQQQPAPVAASPFEVTGFKEGVIRDARTNAVTTHNVTRPLVQRNVSDAGPAFDAFLYQDKVREYGVQAAVNSFESISNLIATASFYGIDPSLRDAIIARTAPQLMKPAPTQPSQPAEQQALPAPGFNPTPWGAPSSSDAEEARKQRQIEEMRAKYYGGKRR